MKHRENDATLALVKNNDVGCNKCYFYKEGCTGPRNLFGICYASGEYMVWCETLSSKIARLFRKK